MPVRRYIEKEIKEEGGVRDPRYVVVCHTARNQILPDPEAITAEVADVVASGRVKGATVHSRGDEFPAGMHSRHVAVFICGDFELEEAARFVEAAAATYSGAIPLGEYFRNRKVIVETFGWSLGPDDDDLSPDHDLRQLLMFDEVKPMDS